MNTEPIKHCCPKCQAPLLENAPQGLCPKCLLAAAATPTETGKAHEKNPPPSLEEVAAAFPQLQILEIIGQGGMGVVYKARQPRLDRLVALKLLPLSLAADATFAERFNREARVLARLNHPHIVTVHDFGQSGGFFYLLMEFVDGVNLRQAMQAGRFTPHQAILLVPKICEALQFAHDEGVLHRDIKPENILLDTRGRVKIADFGIAKLVGETREKLTLTASGQAIGTPHYMAPEQLERPQDVDQRADIYSLGVVFYEMLTGELPIGRFAPPSTKTAVDSRVDEVVFHALEKEREKRFRSAGEVKTSVEAITAQQAASPAPPGSGLRTTCYFNTPARMRDCFPSAAARVFTCKGELALDGENLTFTSTWRSTLTIPLKDIQDLSVGQFQMWTTPWVMKYARVNFLSVTFRREGQLQTVHLTPVEPGAMSAGQINDCVGRWFERVRQAIQRCTGKLPRASDTTSLLVSAEPAWNRRALPLVLGCLLAAIATWLLQAYTVLGPAWLVTFVVIVLAVVVLLWFSVTFLRANSALWHGELDLVTSDDPPEPEPAGVTPAFGPSPLQRARWARTSFTLISLWTLAIVLLLAWLSYRNRYTPPSRAGAGGGVPAASAAFTPAAESRLVLYTVSTLLPSGPPASTGRMEWDFKCLLPAQHLAHLLLIRWTNGVPVVENAGSAYYEVGKDSLDQTFSIICEPFRSNSVPKVHVGSFWGYELTEGPLLVNPRKVRVEYVPRESNIEQPPVNPTNSVQWLVDLLGRGYTLFGLPREAAYRGLQTPPRLIIHSGHQGILRLVDYSGPSSHGQSGIELRIFLEPMNYAPVRVDPFEVQGTDYVAGHGPGWTEDQALKAIKDWPVDK